MSDICANDPAGAEATRWTASCTAPLLGGDVVRCTEDPAARGATVILDADATESAASTLDVQCAIVVRGASLAGQRLVGG